VNKDVQLYKIRYSIIIISLTIGMLIFCYVISKSISRPLVKIVQSLKEVSTGSGDLTKRIHKNKVNCSKFLKCNYHDCQLYDKEVTDCINIVGSRAPNFGNKIKCPSILNGTYKSCEECKIMEKIIPNELSELTFYFDSFVLKIHNIIKEAQEVAEKLTEYSKGLASESLQLSDHVQGQAASAEEITATVEEMSAGISNVSTRAGHQSTSLLSMISKMQELSDYIAKMGTVINDTEKQTEIINNDAKSGVSSLKEMNNSMQNVHDSSDEMKNIVDIINEISDKINLLSLNAAIESARAGEAGRGFSVVSDEISKLADQTAVSIKDISNLIKVNSNEITKGIKKLDESLEKIHTIMNGVNTIFEMMNKISDLMNKQSEMNESVNEETDNVKRFSDEIRTATEEQNTAANEIVKSITNINELTQTNASSVEEMTSTMKTINDMAENLQSKVSLFKV
ncbi:MAG: methyl-accepting chemotaxis protein, partial [Spirochaetota bacterium]|nr:methyl-accepting chemotaxis protein [Spirochaetota bacterium]